MDPSAVVGEVGWDGTLSVPFFFVWVLWVRWVKFSRKASLPVRESVLEFSGQEGFFFATFITYPCRHSSDVFGA